ncbi:hypothetical protein [Nitrosomonas sp. Is37]|uniref:hypothetical protein n=1 Tax=Nitrosomonas sp. Is37 TaxID=3080535 RepID=UPI00294B93D9|nr:hypothetical protein [Nitrosomonas sp. Is37]MDV6343793.1 hypothetical protein [Nitrosomonas sp. Is37]
MTIDENLVQAVWEKGRGTLGQDISEWRQDQCGAWISRQKYNNAKSEYGWKIVNVKPGSPDHLENLQPFHLENDFDIANDKPHCRVTADRSGLMPTQSVDTPHNTSV